MGSQHRQKRKPAQKQLRRSAPLPSRFLTVKAAGQEGQDEPLRVTAQLRHHVAVAYAELTERKDDGRFTVTLKMRVNLPSRTVRDGVTPEGIKGEERVVLQFCRDWPRKAPKIGLRPSFPSHLAHINPHRKGDLVPPCIVEAGNNDDLLHARGLDGVIDQLAEWLARAAGGSLANYGEGWEPRRRENASGRLKFSSSELIDLMPSDGTVRTIAADYLGNDTWTGIELVAKEEEAAPFTQKALKSGWHTGKTAVFVARAPTVDGEVQVFDKYQPDTTSTVDEFLECAAEVGVDGQAVIRRIQDYLSESIARHGTDPKAHWPMGFAVGVVLGVERPARLVGSFDQTTELLTYQLKVAASALQAPFEKQAEVHPTWHAEKGNPRLLAAMSGHPDTDLQQRIVVLGVGSLGSKISSHLGRAGFGRQVLIDKGHMQPHNAARHALTGTGNKAEKMKEVLVAMGHSDVAHSDADLRQLLAEPLEVFEKVVPRNAALLIDTTASPAVLHGLVTTRMFVGAEPRVARAGLYGGGRVAVLMLEAPGRAARLDDIDAALFVEAARDTRLRDAMAASGAGLSPVFVGQNCRSMTMTMSDAALSRGASLVAMQIERWLNEGLPPYGILCIGLEDDTGLGMSWRTVVLEATDVLRTTNWEVRVLADVAKRIDTDARQWTPKETGGALLGCVSFEDRTIIASGLIEAPPDSERSEARFVLGTSGLKDAVGHAADASAGHWSFIGTWHSHPQGGSHSGIDVSTLARLALQARGAPSVSLVWTPTGLQVQTMALSS